MLRSIAMAVVDTAPGPAGRRISLIDGYTVGPAVPFDTVAEIDALCAQLAEGPDLTAVRDHPVHIIGLSTAGRVPKFAATAVACGLHSVGSFRLFGDGQDRGPHRLRLSTARV
jgi:hypothetical protein